MGFQIAAGMWEGMRSICALQYSMERSVCRIHSFSLQSKGLFKKWLAASKDVHRVLINCRGNALAEIIIVAATEKI